MICHFAFIAAALILIAGASDVPATPPNNDGLKVWITKGGSYCIREIAVFGRVRCQNAMAWSKEGVTFTRSGPPASAASSRPLESDRSPDVGKGSNP
jgi:hypothetical protein